MRLTSQKRLAAEILNCSASEIWVDPERLQDIKESITKADIRTLIIAKAIQRKPVQRKSSGRTRILRAQKLKGRRRGVGSRKGRATAREKPKREWMNKVRAQRKLLQDLREKNRIDNTTFRGLYLKSKGGFFRSRRHIEIYIKEHGLEK